MSNSAQRPILIVDKEGTLGLALTDKLSQLSLTLLVSSQQHHGSNVISIPFHKKIPSIPDNSFSHIFLVYSGEKELEEAISSFIKKAQETKAQLVLVTSLFHYTEGIAERLFSLYEHAQVIVVGDVFSKATLSPSSPVNLFLFQAKTFGRVELSHTGLDPLYPVALSDAISGIIAAAFTLSEDRQIFAVLPKHPLTQLSFARLLQKDYPMLKIDFLKGKQPLPYSALPHSAIPVSEDFPLAKRLKELDLTHTPLASPLSKKAQKKLTFKPITSQKRTPFFVLSLVFFVIALPFIVTIGAALTGGLLLKQTEQLAEKGSLSQALVSAKAAQTFLSLSDQTATTLRAVVSVVGLSHEVVGFQSLIHSGKEVADATAEFLEAGMKLQTILTGSTQASRQDYLSAIGQLKEAMTSLQVIEAEDSLPPAYKASLATFQKPMNLLINLVDASSQLLGFEGKQRYLILFQNNFELRPGGGFIGSYALMDIDHGKMTNVSINDVYDADGKLTARVDPPFALKRYMGSSHWFLRDSNFDPDFPTSASQAASFLKLETGESVNGVFGIDVSFLSSLLEATGPIKLADYQQTLTKDNFYLLTQSHAETNFFPGSTQKKDFLRAAEGELLKRLQNKQFSYQKMITLLSQATVQKHLLFAFPDPLMQKLFTVNELSASIVDGRDKAPNTFLDSAGINEANIGQNKSNYYLKRKIDQNITVDGEGIVTENTKITYTNTSAKSSPFGGDYKAYVRLIIPNGATLTDVMLDNVQQAIVPAVTNEDSYSAKSFKVPKGIEVEQSTEKGKAMFGLLMTVAQGQTKILTFSYRLQDRVKVDSQEWSYDFHAVKQQGTGEDPYTLTLNYPLAVRLFTSSQGVNDLGGKAVYEAILNQDQDLRFTFVVR